jgi:uncharacterized protein (TIGR03067 family)
MQRTIVGCLFASGLLASLALFAAADDAKNESTKKDDAIKKDESIPKDEAIKKDRKLYEGTWRVVALEISGQKSGDDDAKKLSVLNGADGSWSLRSEDREIARGRNVIDPTTKPKTIDVIEMEDGKDKLTVFGIYEITEKTRRLCYAMSGRGRPTDFTSTSTNEQVLITFEREMPK